MTIYYDDHNGDYNRPIAITYNIIIFNELIMPVCIPLKYFLHRKRYL